MGRGLDENTFIKKFMSISITQPVENVEDQNVGKGIAKIPFDKKLVKPDSKICNSCHITRPITDFANKGGCKRRGYCNDCRNRKNRKTHRSSTANPFTALVLYDSEFAVWQKSMSLRAVQVCRKCRETKDIGEFPPKTKICKKCINKHAASRLTQRRRLNPHLKIKDNLACRIRMAFARYNLKKDNRTIDFIGCSYNKLRSHFESKFVEGMAWENHGSVWHIDHIRPCASFDLTRPEEQLACFHYSNLQPLFVADNLKKGAKYIHA
jgi:hypothetical protein